MTAAEEFDEVVSRVRSAVDPSPVERERMERVRSELTDRATAAIDSLPVDADVIQVGSTARGTWISGERDIDLFVRFPPSIDRNDLETYGLRVGHEVLPDGHEEFAEHPYVKGTIDGFDIDLVPCYDVADAGEIKSAVDRTPFHTAYVREQLTSELKEDVRLTKQFFTGIGVYGSDLRTQGFSGYLTELLVIEYGGFEPLIDAACDWHPPVELDPEDHGATTFDDPLVVIDPTDPNRNVAAVLSASNVARFQHYARVLRTDPSENLFYPDDRDGLTVEELETVLDNRGTTPIAIRFEAPDLVDDQLYPQLQRSLRGIRKALDRRGFDVCRTRAMAAETGVLLFEVSVPERPAIERHEGPPVHVKNHAMGFFEKYAQTDAYGPFIDNGRYVVERQRAYERASVFLASDELFSVGLGTHIKDALEHDYEVLVGEEITTLVGEFSVELAEYFDPKP